jgi:hypothetical protein
MGEGLLTRVAFTRDRDLTHPQQESTHSSWGAKGSHVFGHPFSDGDDLDKKTILILSDSMIDIVEYARF